MAGSEFKMSANFGSGQRVRLSDIADKLGVSQVTVSLALRNNPRISAERRQQIQELALKMGYQPDAMASALAHKKWNNREVPVTSELAWLNFWSPPEKLRSLKEFNRYWQGASMMAKSKGYHLEEFAVSKEMSLKRIDQILRSRNIRGILIPPIQDIKTDFTGIEWDNYSVVRFGYSIKTLPAHAVVADQLGAGLLAFQKIYEKGYRRIGFVTTEASEPNTMFLAGFLLGHSRIEGAVRIPPLLLPRKTRDIMEITDEDRKILAAWLKKNQPDAIFTSHAPLRQMIEEIGYCVPDQIGLAATSVLDTPIDAGIDQNSEDLGKMAMELLISLIHHDERGLPKYFRLSSMESDWVDGSCLPIRKPAESHAKA